jgi:hypothetical protein
VLVSGLHVKAWLLRSARSFDVEILSKRRAIHQCTGRLKRGVSIARTRISSAVSQRAWLAEERILRTSTSILAFSSTCSAPDEHLPSKQQGRLESP